MQLDPENIEALVALGVMDLQTNEGLVTPLNTYSSFDFFFADYTLEMVAYIPVSHSAVN